MTSSPFAAADALYGAITRVWANPERRVAECTRFAARRSTLGLVGTVYPMQLAQVLASQGWTVQQFTTTIS